MDAARSTRPRTAPAASNSNSSSPPASARPQRDSAFWQLLALLAEEPDLRWLGWVLRQRQEGAAHAESTPPPTPRSRTRPDFAATFRDEEQEQEEEEEDLADQAEAPPAGGATGGDVCPAHHCPLCSGLACQHFGPWPLEALSLVERSAHPRMWKIYQRGLVRFLRYREEADLSSIWPIPKEQVRGFLVALDYRHLPSPKILGYLAGLSHISRMFHFPDPLQDFVVSRMVMAIHRRGDVQRSGCTPVTLELLRCLVGAVESVAGTFYNRLLFRATFILAWFAALRPEELVAEDSASLHPALLRLGDFRFAEDTIDVQLRVLGDNQERFAFRLVRSKEPWLCPVLALSNYLEARPRREGPFFLCGNGEPLTKGLFLSVLEPTLRLLGLLPQQFSLQSFWLGSLITAVKSRLPNELILRLARQPNRGPPQQ
ncbi:uncharacterized protein LOC143819777 [Paroedura picta]|uniref:uncharacterized protein LOC143819777 n=1 Tax=Paroedura picta TaxID=143630 RepID=UPI0040578731